MKIHLYAPDSCLLLDDSLDPKAQLHGGTYKTPHLPGITLRSVHTPSGALGGYFVVGVSLLLERYFQDLYESSSLLRQHHAAGDLDGPHAEARMVLAYPMRYARCLLEAVRFGVRDPGAETFAWLDAQHKVAILPGHDNWAPDLSISST